MVLSRWRRAPGASALAAAAIFAAALGVVAVTLPLLPADRPLPRSRPGARARLAALDGFDARVRPAAMITTRSARCAAADVVPQLSLGVKPVQRADPQPMRVIHNGRFSLPAGTYDIDVTFGDRVPVAADAAVAADWTRRRGAADLELQPQPGEHWRTSMWLPVDAGFVGFRGPLEMERAIAAIAITPAAVVNAGARPQAAAKCWRPPCTRRRSSFTTSRCIPEPEGFWTIGRRTAG